MTAELDPWAFDLGERVPLAVSLLETHRCAFSSCARVIAETVAILTDAPGVSPRPVTVQRENECAPETAPTDPGTTCTTSLSTRPTEGGPLPMILDHSRTIHAGCADRRAEDAAIIRRLRTDLARAVQTRAHWFVDDGNGYCLACGLPASNARHSERAA